MTALAGKHVSQRGSSLILLIGVIAALAILAAAMVILTSNVLHNTARHRAQSKAFNVAEAGLDAGQAAAWVNWPVVPTDNPVLPGDFMAQFSASEFPRPASGQPITVRFYDDDGSGVTSPGMRTGFTYDENANDLLWIVAESNIAGRRAQVMALVEKMSYTLTIKERNALITDSDLLVDGSGLGGGSVVGVDPPPDPPPADYASVIYKGEYVPNGKPTFNGATLNPPGSETVTLSSIFPDEILLALIQKAQGEGRYFANTSQIPNTVAFWSASPRLVVAETGNFDMKFGAPETDIDANGDPSVWSANNPGILILLNGNLGCDGGGGKKLYGIVYLMGGMLLRGGPEIHGMVLAKGVVDLRGSRSVSYNQDVINNLNKPIIQSVRIRPGTWRELTPQ